jgi:hypothetical protein
MLYNVNQNFKKFIKIEFNKLKKFHKLKKFKNYKKFNRIQYYY